MHAQKSSENTSLTGATKLGLVQAVLALAAVPKAAVRASVAPDPSVPLARLLLP